MAPPKKISLSKSSFALGLQCPKALYFKLKHPELDQPVSESTQAIFDQGNRIGVEARKYFPGGVLISAEHWNKGEAVAQTIAAIKSGAKVIFEAALEHDGLHVKVDVLSRKRVAGPWSLIEVKSAKDVSAANIADVTIQTHVAKASGLAVKDSSVMVLNRDCVFPKLENLFRQQLVTDEVEPLLSAVPAKLKQLRAILMQPKAPGIEIGPQCSSPYECPYTRVCQKGKIPSPSVFDFPGVGPAKGWKLYKDGVVKLSDKRFGPFEGVKALQLKAARTGKRWVDVAVIAKHISTWKWPLHFLDFETVGFAIPRFAGTGPFDAVPFQFSCHVQKGLGAKPVHIEFLHEGLEDPRPGFIKALLAAIGPKGDIVSYNKRTEMGEIRKLAEDFPQFARELSTLVDRFVDPLPVFQQGVYDPAFAGGFSIKDVAPAILGKAMDYSGMDVGDGRAAGRAYEELIAVVTLPRRRAELRKALLEYCEKDTAAMVGLVGWLFGQIPTD